MHTSIIIALIPPKVLDFANSRLSLSKLRFLFYRRKISFSFFFDPAMLVP